MEKLLNETLTTQVQDLFKEIPYPVHVLLFTQAGADYCAETRQLLEEVVALSDKLSLAVYDIDEDAPTAKQYKIDRVPGIVIAGKDGETITDYHIRYSGIPAGHEFTSLVNDLVMVGSRNSGLNESTRAFLKTLDKTVHLDVYVTPT